ncbi:LpqB family beta-propeller domain-containing protein [Phytomonospora endophytica]|uniref:GerMN domain-containing protein n=1 Tax=Phytomonospora endophytica TaxID=714109 RepID=A0A841G1K8_9ACTN|nr:LpqB family beta-propeller domain-containing protein [Phytomonospora endophytica]MBB6039642.1 hypothetical protein [Phytomonospora endophytica]GIG65639.1 hypothetical protein Pen01_19340 [Phytomonospora endophytica]
MDRRRSPLLAVVLSAGVVLSGCGVPADGPATEIAIEQNGGSGFSDPGPSSLEPETDAGNSLRNFLGAAAGISTTRGERLNKFFVSPSTEPIEQSQVVNVIRQTDLTQLPDSENGQVNYRLRAEIVGVYDQWGQLSPPDGKRDFTMDFRLAKDQPDGKWRLVDRPTRLLLDEEAFKGAYMVSPLYFQRVGSTALVPDIRYTYKYATDDRTREELVDWLLHGPSTWLSRAVTTAFPSATKLNRPPTQVGGALVIDLGSDAVTGDEEKMAAQLAWTLWDAAGGLSLRLERNAQPVFESTISAYADRNPTAVFADDTNSVLHRIDNGLVLSASTTGSGPYQGVEDAKYVANSVSRQHTALVHDSNKLTVYVVSSTKLAEQVVTPFPVTGLPSGTVGRPTWVGEETLLVPVGGRLYAVNDRGGGTWKAQSGSLISGVGRVSAAPDGGRLALTVDGRAYVVPVIPQGDGTVELGDRRPVDRAYDNVVDVGWSEEHRLILLNSGPENFLRSVTIDNVQVEQLKDNGPSFPPDFLTVLCDSPVGGRSTSAKVYVVVDKKIYQAESRRLRELQNTDGTPMTGTAPFF